MRLRITFLTLYTAFVLGNISGQQAKDSLLFAQKLENAQVAYDSSELDQALFDVEQILSSLKTPEQADVIVKASILKSKVLRKKGQYQNAIDALESVEHITSSSSITNSELIVKFFLHAGIANRFADKNETALLYFEKAIQLGESIGGNATPLVGEAYSEIGVIKRKEGAYDRAIFFLEKADEVYLNFFGENSFNSAYVYENMGRTLRGKREYDTALSYHWKAANIYIDSLGTEYFKLALSYNSIAIIHKRKGEFHKALKYYELAYGIHKNHYGDNHPQASTYLNNLGGIYNNIGAYQEALEHHRKAVELIIKTWGNDSKRLASSYTNIGIINRKMGNLESSLDYHQKATEIHRKYRGNNHPRVATSLNNLGVAQYKLKNYTQAIESFKESLKIITTKFGENYSFAADINNNIGLVLLDEGKYDSAFKYFEKALNITQNTLGQIHPKAAKHLNNIGTVHLKNKNIDLAISFHKMAINALNFDKNSELKFEGVEDKILLIKTFNFLGEAYLEKYNESKKQTYLRLSLNEYNDALNLIQHIRSTYTEEKSRQLLNANHFNVFSNSIEVNLKLYELTDSIKYFDSAFKIIETTKSLELLAVLQSPNAAKIFDLPDSLWIQENDLIEKITALEKNHFLNFGPGYDPSNTEASNSWDAIFNLKQKKRDFNLMLEKEYPNYFNFRIQHNSIPIKELQKSLKNDEAWLEYFVGDEYIFTFYLERNSISIKKVDLDFPLEDWINQLQLGITDYFQSGDLTLEAYNRNILKYREYAFLLYDKLLGSQKNLAKNITIVPDGPLWHIPFELLLTHPTDKLEFKSFPYLIKKHIVNYNYSATLWQQMKLKKINASSIVAFAPDFSETTLNSTQRNGIQAVLHYNKNEAIKICELTNGQIFSGTSATLDELKNTSKKYGVFHFATHAQVNNIDSDYNYLLLQNGVEYEKLYVKDLYSLNMPANMVVLSACETGLGQLRKGEGMASLSTGFAYAGAKSLVTSLWKINDQSTEAIMIEFYKNIVQGQSKSEAMRNAKLSYMLSQPDDQLAAPYYWGAFITLGDASALEINNTVLYLPILGVILISLVAFFIWFKMHRT